VRSLSITWASASMVGMSYTSDYVRMEGRFLNRDRFELENFV